jgi:hypothetical protein
MLAPMKQASGAPRQARRTRSEWTIEVARWRQSGLTASAYSIRNGLSVASLRWWSSQLRTSPSTGSALRFVPLRVALNGRTEQAPFALDVVLRNGRTVRVRSDVDAMRLACLLDALEGGAE